MNPGVSLGVYIILQARAKYAQGPGNRLRVDSRGVPQSSSERVVLLAIETIDE